MVWTGWETKPAGSLGSVCWNGSLGSLLCLYWFLVIQSQNCTSSILLDSLVCERFSYKVSEFLSIVWTC